jgi:uncharacterized protein
VRTVFADTGYWIALLNKQDSLHEKAKAVSAALGAVRIVTSETVLAELLNDFAGRGAHLRNAAVQLVEDCQRNPNVSVVLSTSLSFREALALYKQRADKAWSHTDCVSFFIMQREKLTEALTHDKHFEQASFQALLREK